MNQEKTGKFIAAQRKKKKMTQSELAEKLGVSINAVSKWERGISFPDVSLYKKLCSELGISIEELIKITKEIYPPKGRCETYKVKDGFAVVDYAHTPDAVEKIINTAREMTKGDIYTVFGCTGNRDRTKRPIMTDIVTNLSTKAIITIDDLHDEEAEDIINDMLKRT